jgi:hypothetical protein
MWKVDQLPAEKQARYDQFVTMMLTLSSNHARTKQLAKQIFELGWDSGWKSAGTSCGRTGRPSHSSPGHVARG